MVAGSVFCSTFQGKGVAKRPIDNTRAAIRALLQNTPLPILLDYRIAIPSYAYIVICGFWDDPEFCIGGHTFRPNIYCVICELPLYQGN